MTESHCPPPEKALPSPPTTSSDGIAQPPHPFRSTPWYDPRLVKPATAPPLQRLHGRVALVALGAIALPVISVAINAILKVVALGPWGVALVLLTTLPPLAQLLWLPVKRRGKQGTKEVVAPRSTLALATLLGASLLSALIWVYLAVLFLPLLPLSVVVVLFGIGLCGLCPYLAGSVSVVHAVRTTRQLAARIGRKRTTALVAATLLLPIIMATMSTLKSARRWRVLAQKLTKVVKAPAFSTERMRAIASLEPQLARLPEAFARERDLSRRRAINEAYQRLTDRRLDLWRIALRERQGQIRPWWFVEGRAPFSFRLLNGHLLSGRL